eukprot:GEMP01052073.1.p1 GENE.GEMP01052073.1~~GEMP01052073.1.p1  ORF type:complete len:284 (+),score=45.31 GEMP01052073.1:140-991(+)
MTSTMPNLVHIVKPSDLQVGDHVYTWRMCGIYAHHGIVVQVNPIGVVHLDTGGVRLTGLNIFAGSASLHKVKYGCSWLESSIKRPGTCSTNSPDEPFVVALRALSLVETESDGERRVRYDVIDKNCESFCRFCVMGPRTGINDFRTTNGPCSLQSNAKNVAKNIILASSTFLVVSSFVGPEVAMAVASASGYALRSALARGTISPDEDFNPTRCSVVNRILMEQELLNIPQMLLQEAGVEWNDSSASLLCEMFIDDIDKNEHEGFSDLIANQALLDTIRKMMS